MDTVVSLVDWLTKYIEVVRVSRDQKLAVFSIVIYIIYVVISIDCQVVTRKHHLDWFEERPLSTIHIRLTP